MLGEFLGCASVVLVLIGIVGILSAIAIRHTDNKERQDYDDYFG